MAIFETLKEEHDVFRSLYNDILSQNPKSETFERFNRLLDIHMLGEEEFVYPVTKTKDLKMETLESVEEHHVAKLLQGELESMSGQEENWKPKLEVLVENIEHHLKDEEQKLFPKSSQRISQEEQQQMDDRYNRLKSSAGITF